MLMNKDMIYAIFGYADGIGCSDFMNNIKRMKFMNKTILSLTVALVMLPVSLAAQTYASLWTQEQAAEKKDLPKTQLEVLRKIVAKAAAENEYGQLMKAELKSIAVETGVSPDSLLPALRRMESKERAESNAVAKAVYAAVLYRIYTDNARHIGDGADSAATRYRKSATSEPARLAAARAAGYEPFVARGYNASVFGGDMLSVVAYEVEDFMTMWRWYKDAGMRPAACISALELLRNYRPAGGKRLDKSEYINSLDSIIHVYEDLDIACEVAIERYDYMQKCPDVTAGDKIAFIRRALDKWGGWQRANYLRNAERELTASQMSLEAGRYRVGPGVGQTVRLSNLRNITSLTMNVYRAAVNGDYRGTPRNSNDYRRLKPLLTALPDRRQERTYMSRPGYQQFEDSIELGTLPVGVYMLEFQTVPATKTIRQIYYVTDVYCMSHPLPGDSVRYVVVSATTGQPLPGAKIRVKGTGRRQADAAVTFACDANGEAVGKLTGPDSGREIYAYTDKDKAAPVWSAYGRYSYSDNRNFREMTAVFTDRRIYRPGQTVHVAAVVYESDGAISHKSVGGKAVKAVLRDANYKIVDERELVTDGYGSCSTDFTLPVGTLNGAFTVQVNGTSSSVRVEEYKRPTFRVEFPDINEKYKNGDTLMVRARATTYAGVPVQGAAVSYTVRRNVSLWWRSSNVRGKVAPYYPGSGDNIFNGTATTGADGTFVVEVPVVLPDDVLADRRMPVFYDFVVDADVTDMGGETHSGSMRIPLGSRTTVLTSDMPEKVLADSLKTLTFTLSNAAGINVDADVRFRIDSGEWQVARTGSVFAFGSRLASGRHRLEAVCETDTLEQDFIVFGLDDTVPPADTRDWFYVSAESFPADGGPVTVQVGSSDKDVHVIYTIVSGNTVVESGRTDIGNALINRKFTYDEKYGNGLTLLFAWVKKGECHTHSVSIRRPVPDTKLKMKWTTFRDRLTPGQKEEWRMTVLRPDGTPADAQLMATLYDKSLDQIARHDWSFSPSVWLNVPYLPLHSPRVSGFSAWGMASWKSLSWKEFAPSRFDSSLFPGSYYGMVRSMRIRGGAMYKMSQSVTYDSAAESDVVSVEEAAPMASGGFVVGLAKMRNGAAVKEEAKEISTESQDGGDESGGQEVQMRENLDETAFFYPALLADKDGSVSLAFTLPGSLTTWRFIGMAHTADMFSGIIGGEVVAAKEVMVQPNVPRFVRVGDKARIQARIFNTGKGVAKGKARMVLTEPNGGREVYSQAVDFSVSPDSTAVVAFGYVPDGTHSLLVCRITAAGKTFSDGEQHYLPVLPDGEQVTVTVPFTQNGPGVKSVDISKLFPAKSKDGKLTVEYAGNPAWMMVQALPSMGTPRDDNAVEQAVSLYANTIAGSIISRNPAVKTAFDRWRMERGEETSLMSSLEKNASLKDIVLSETPWVADADREAEQKQRLADFFNESTAANRRAMAIDKLAKLQLADGSWSWCPGMDGSMYMTVEIAQMLVRLNAMTGAVNDTKKMLSSAIGYMDKEIVKDVEEMKKAERKGVKPSFPGVTTLQYLYLRAVDGRSRPASVQSACNYLIALLKKDIAGQTIYEKALTAIILAKHGETQRSREYVRSLKEYTVYTEEMGRYYDTRRAAYSWRDYKIPTEVAAIEAIRTVTPSDTQTVDEMRRWLLQQKRTQAWDTPVNSVDAVYAFLFDNMKELAAREQTVLAVDGKVLALPEATAGIGYVRTAVNGPKGNTFTATKTSEGTSWGAVYAQFMQKTSDIKASGSGISVKREVLVKTGDKKDKSAEKAVLSVGDRIVVRITIEAGRDLDFVQIVDRRAACMEPVGQLSGYRNGMYCSPKDNTTNYYIDRMPKGKRVIETEYYIDRAGTYETGTCTAGCAYAPEYRATAKSHTFVVK